MKADRIGIVAFCFGIAVLHPLAASAQATPGAGTGDTPVAVDQAIAWEKAPGKSELSFYEPDRAQRMAQNGTSSMRCNLAAAGSLSTCEVMTETPVGFGFGLASLKLAKFFKAAPAAQDRMVVVTVHWNYRGGSTIESVPAT